MRASHILLMLTLLSSGCSDRGAPPVAPPTPEAGTPDSSVADSALPDGTVGDASVPDATLMDADGPDGDSPDADVSDARLDADTPDADVPDARLDAEVPDADRPDAMVDAGGGLACAPTDLGMRMGVDLATGSTAALRHMYTPSCGSSFSPMPSPEAIYSWEAPRDGTFTIDTNGSDFDTLIFVTMGDCSGAEIACDDDGGASTRSRARVTLTAGDAITIFVEGYGGASGDYSLSITESPETEAGACGDMVDNDRDGAVDCADSDCRMEPGCSELDCTDGADDDGDGDIDCLDFDCSSDPACSETDCADGLDDEGDGRIDCDDFDCFGDMACGETMCTDGVDDDSDTYTDCDDSECRCDPGCMAGGDGCATEATDLGGRTGMGVATGMVEAGLCSRRRGTCAGGGPEVYFEFTAPRPGVYSINTDGSTYDTVLYAHDMSCTGVELACNDDDPSTFGVTSSIELTLRAMQSIIIVLDGFSTSSAGDYTLNIVAPPMIMPMP